MNKKTVIIGIIILIIILTILFLVSRKNNKSPSPSPPIPSGDITCKNTCEFPYQGKCISFDKMISMSSFLLKMDNNCIGYDKDTNRMGKISLCSWNTWKKGDNFWFWDSDTNILGIEFSYGTNYKRMYLRKPAKSMYLDFVDSIDGDGGIHLTKKGSIISSDCSLCVKLSGNDFIWDQCVVIPNKIGVVFSMEEPADCYKTGENCSDKTGKCCKPFSTCDNGKCVGCYTEDKFQCNAGEILECSGDTRKWICRDEYSNCSISNILPAKNGYNISCVFDSTQNKWIWEYQKLGNNTCPANPPENMICNNREDLPYTNFVKRCDITTDYQWKCKSLCSPNPPSSKCPSGKIWGCIRDDQTGFSEWSCIDAGQDPCSDIPNPINCQESYCFSEDGNNYVKKCKTEYTKSDIAIVEGWALEQVVNNDTGKSTEIMFQNSSRQTPMCPVTNCSLPNEKCFIIRDPILRNIVDNPKGVFIQDDKGGSFDPYNEQKHMYYSLPTSYDGSGDRSKANKCYLVNPCKNEASFHQNVPNVSNTDDGNCVCVHGCSGNLCEEGCCSGSGTVKNGQCVCSNGCEGTVCNLNCCSNKGTVKNGKCVCNNRCKGDLCEGNCCEGSGVLKNGKCVCDYCGSGQCDGIKSDDDCGDWCFEDMNSVTFQLDLEVDRSTQGNNFCETNCGSGSDLSCDRGINIGAGKGKFGSCVASGATWLFDMSDGGCTLFSPDRANCTFPPYPDNDANCRIRFIKNNPDTENNWTPSVTSTSQNISSTRNKRLTWNFTYNMLDTYWVNTINTNKKDFKLEDAQNIVDMFTKLYVSNFNIKGYTKIPNATQITSNKNKIDKYIKPWLCRMFGYKIP